MAKVDSRASALRFVYPFLFEPRHFPARVAAIDQAAWSGGKQPVKAWEDLAIPVDDLLSYVADFVRPPEGAVPAARFWSLRPDALRSASGLAAGAGHAAAAWSLVAPGAELPFALEAVELALFQDGVGFLTFRARPADDRLASWLDFLHYFRFARGQRGARLRAERTVGVDPQTRQPRTQPFFPEPAGGAARHPDGTGALDDLVRGLLADPEGGAVGAPWWEDVFVPGQLLPYATLFVDDLPAEEIPPLLYRVRNFFHSRQEIAPAADDLRPDHPALLPYAVRQWFVFSLDGGAFVAADAPRTPFFRQVLPDHLAKQYYLLFLLALEQRFTLLRLSQEVARHWLPWDVTTDDEKRAVTFARIRDALLSFTARGYFAQVMQQEHHHRCYRQWQETFQIARLYQEVSGEVREMHGYLDLRYRQRLETLTRHQEDRARGVERRLTLVTWLLGVPSFLFIYLAAIPGITEAERAEPLHWLGLPLSPSLITLGLGIVALGIGMIGYRLVGRIAK